MAVLIEGMEMPKSCDDCYIANCPNDIGYTDRGKCSRHINCPIIEVPEPHGRLIDADVLCNRLEIASRTSHEMREAIEYVAKWIVKYVPTVIPASEEVE